MVFVYIGAVGGPGMECFKTLVDLLKCGSDEQLTDVIQHYFVGNFSRYSTGHLIVLFLPHRKISFVPVFLNFPLYYIIFGNMQKFSVVSLIH